MLTSLLSGLNGLTPLAIIGLLGLVLLFQAKNRDKLTEVTDNHLHSLPEQLETLKRMEWLLQDIKDNTVWIKARLNGHGGA